MTQLQQILDNNPLLHEEAQGKLTSWQLSEEVLSFIDKNVQQNHRTLEIGAGVSTILFGAKSSIHTCITPSENQVTRIETYCENNQISTEKIDFKIGFSEKILPSLETHQLDLILIDGSHAFPLPFLDWFYSYQKLKLGGKLIIDDTQLWTGKVLKQFLCLEPEWQFNVNSPPRSAIFTKVKNYNRTKWHNQQPYLVKHSHLSILNAKLKMLWQFLLQGEFGKLGKLINEKIKAWKIR